MDLLILLALVSLLTSAYAVYGWLCVPRLRRLALLVLLTAVGLWSGLYGGMFYVVELLYFFFLRFFLPDPLWVVFLQHYLTIACAVVHLTLAVYLMWRTGRVGSVRRDLAALGRDPLGEQGQSVRE